MNRGKIVYATTTTVIQIAAMVKYFKLIHFVAQLPNEWHYNYATPPTIKRMGANATSRSYAIKGFLKWR